MSTEKASMKPIFDFIPKKPAQVYSLAVSARPIITSDFNILPDLEHAQKLMPLDQIRVEVSYDGEILGALALLDQPTMTWHLLDDKDIGTHELSVCLKGKQDGHSVEAQGKMFTVCVAVDIMIENIPVVDVITGGGKLLLGENDRPVALPLTTPVYRWLLEKYNVFYKKNKQRLWADVKTRF